MKKIIGILGIAILSTATFLSTNEDNSSSNLILDNVLAMNSANAEDSGGVDCFCALFHGNNECAANNYGQRCAPEGKTNCDDYDVNCEG